MITIPQLNDASTLLDSDDVMITHIDETSEKVSGIHLKESVLKVISGLTAATELDDTDIVYIKDTNGDLKKVTGALIKEGALDSISGLTAASAFADTDVFAIKDNNGDLKKLTGALIKSSQLTTASFILSGTTITGPTLATNAKLQILFTAAVTGADTSTALSITYNTDPITVKVCKDGALVDFTAQEISSGTYTYLQSYTTLELVYDGTYFIVVGNPIVISDDGYAVHADGTVEKDTEFYCDITGGGADDPEAQTGTTYAYSFGPAYGIKVGDVIKVTFAQALQSSSAITKVSLTCGGKTGDIVTVQPDTSITNAPTAGYKWIASHQFAGGNYSATYMHKVWDANTTLKLTWTGTYWLADSDTVVCSYASSSVSYLIKTNGLIKQWGVNKKGSNLAAETSWGFTINLPVVYSDYNYIISFGAYNENKNANPSGEEIYCIKKSDYKQISVSFYNRNSGTASTSPCVAWFTTGF